MSADGLGDEWSEHSISGEHNRLVGRRNSTSGMPLAMAAAINETEYTSAYTSLLPVDGGRAARLQYGRRTTPAIFSMLVQLKTEDTASTTAAASAAPLHPNIIMCALSSRSPLSFTALPELRRPANPADGTTPALLELNYSAADHNWMISGEPAPLTAQEAVGLDRTFQKLLVALLAPDG